MKVAISGSRTFVDRDLVELVVDRLLAKGDFIILGDARRGVDDMAFSYLQKKNVDWAHWRVERANWDRFGKGAGHERNGRMLVDADQLIALFAPGDPTPGTSDALDQALLKGIPVFFYHEGTWASTGPSQKMPRGQP